MKDTIYLIHGFNIKDEGAATTGTIKKELERHGYNVIEITYGFFHRMRVRFCNKGLAHVIADLVEPDSTVIAHSNGAAISFIASELGAPWKNMTLVNPALDKNVKFPEQLENIQVWYAPHDKWTGLAKFIPNSIWGAMGRLGYQGDPDNRVIQYDQEKILGRFQDEHSGMFQSDVARKYFVTEQANMIR